VEDYVVHSPVLFSMAHCSGFFPVFSLLAANVSIQQTLVSDCCFLINGWDTATCNEAGKLYWSTE